MTATRRTPVVPVIPTDCPNCGEPWEAGKPFCSNCGYNPQLEAELEELRDFRKESSQELELIKSMLQNNQKSHLSNLANYRLVKEDSSWSPRRLGLTRTLINVLIAFVLGFIASFAAVALNLDTVVFYTPWWEIPVPTGAGFVVFVIWLIIALFNNAKK